MTVLHEEVELNLGGREGEGEGRREEGEEGGEKNGDSIDL